VVDNLVRNLREHSDVPRIHEDYMELGQSKRYWQVILNNGISILFEVSDYLHVPSLHSNIAQLYIEVPMTEIELVHPPEPLHLSS